MTASSKVTPGKKSQLSDYQLNVATSKLSLQTLEAARSAVQLSAANSIVEMSVNGSTKTYNDYQTNFNPLQLKTMKPRPPANAFQSSSEPEISSKLPPQLR